MKTISRLRPENVYASRRLAISASAGKVFQCSRVSPLFDSFITVCPSVRCEMFSDIFWLSTDKEMTLCATCRRWHHGRAHQVYDLLGVRHGLHLFFADKGRPHFSPYLVSDDLRKLCNLETGTPEKARTIGYETAPCCVLTNSSCFSRDRLLDPQAADTASVTRASNSISPPDSNCRLSASASESDLTAGSPAAPPENDPEGTDGLQPLTEYLKKLSLDPLHRQSAGDSSGEIMLRAALKSRQETYQKAKKNRRPEFWKVHPVCMIS
jgi:hypothetical protein